MAFITQTSALPQERPDELLLSINRNPNWRARFTNFLKKEGAYNFAMMAVEIQKYGNEYCIQKYKRSSDEVFSICQSVWEKEVSRIESIVVFLNKLKVNPNYSLKTPTKNVSRIPKTGNFSVNKRSGRTR